MDDSRPRARAWVSWRVRLNADQRDPGVCSFYEANGFTHGGEGFFQKPVPDRGVGRT
ncbi:MAG: hypothetical protein ACYTHN_14775 [Planctomycetota bacterium]